MENAPDAMSQIGAHKKQHKFMKGHLKEGIGRIQADRSGESVDKMFADLQGQLAKLKEQRAAKKK
jgi:enolase